MAESEVCAFEPGTVFEGKYRIDRRLGRGGMGEVYAATHLLLDKPVAVKVLLPELAEEAEMVSRMTQEARAASATGHPNVALVTDMGWTGRQPFLVMELLEGETLHHHVARQGPVQVLQALSWMDQILDALEAVHAKDIIHRDLKPANLMLVPDREGRLQIKILDFGISKRLGPLREQTEHTGIGQIVGTPRAMAPEQARGQPDLDARVDVHAAGSVLYTMLCGRPPFSGKTAMDVMVALLDGRYAPPTSLNGDVPQTLDAILAKALAVEREHRYPSARAFREALAYVRRRFVDGTAFATSGPPPVQSDADLPRDRTLPTPAVPVVEHTTPPTLTAVAEPVLGTPRGDLQPSLQLDVPDGWRAGKTVAPNPPPAPQRARTFNWGWWLLVVVLVAVGVGVGSRWDSLTAAKLPVGDPEAGDTVLLLVETKPKNAVVYVDGVQNDDRPMKIPRSERPLQLRVVAPGYVERKLEVVPRRTHRVTVELERKARSR